MKKDAQIKSKGGFTVIELLILVALIGIISNAIIPRLLQLELQAKRSEIPVNLKAIRASQLSYHQQFLVYVKCSAYPSTPTVQSNTWKKSESGGFKTINWTPDGKVRGSYMVSTVSTNFTATGISDVDGDTVYATFQATSIIDPGMTTPADIY